MSELKATPGPWFVEDFDVHALVDGRSRLVAEVSAPGKATTPHTLPANARLIAAAPEMYEALRALVGMLSGFPDVGDVPTTIDSALAALAKARGEA